MSRIDQMIKELCPEGVERVRLGDICTVLRGKRLTKSQLSDNQKYPVYHGGKDPIGYYSDSNRPADTVMIINVGASAGTVGYSSSDFWSSDGCFCISQSDNVVAKYLYQYLFEHETIIKSQVRNAGIPTLNSSAVENIEIPLPPLSIQQEIVSVLDSFTTLIDKMKQEVEKRKKQMEYYRDKLLTFEDGECEWKTLGELFVIKNGLNKEKDAFGHGTPIINYTDVYKKRCLYSSDVKGLVELTYSEISRYDCKKGDVFFTRTSETKEEVGFPSVLLENIENCTFSGFVLRARPLTDDLLPEYCKYCFFTFAFRKEVIKRATLTTRALTNGSSLSKISIPIPDKDKQSSIVSTLDKFESYISKLEKMIALRQKQYEYYREQLLTFE